MKLNRYLTSYTEINPKWIKDLNIRPETINPPEKIIEGKLLDINLGNDFFVFYIKSKGNKNKNKPERLRQTEKPLHSKGNYQQNEKAPYEMGENISKPYI